MTLNDEMNTAAAAYAKDLFDLGRLEHSARNSRQGQGENLASGCSTGTQGTTVQSAVKSWYVNITLRVSERSLAAIVGLTCALR